MPEQCIHCGDSGPVYRSPATLHGYFSFELTKIDPICGKTISEHWYLCCEHIDSATPLDPKHFVYDIGRKEVTGGSKWMEDEYDIEYHVSPAEFDDWMAEMAIHIEDNLQK